MALYLRPLPGVRVYGAAHLREGTPPVAATYYNASTEMVEAFLQEISAVRSGSAGGLGADGCVKGSTFLRENA